MKEMIIQVIMATVGALGFSILFRVNERNVPAAAIGGGIGWIVYLAMFNWSDNLFFSYLVASIAVCLWAEIIARILKAPSNIYLVPGIIPLIPGGSLFYTTKAIVEGDWQAFFDFGLNTVWITFGMAAGMAVSALIVHLFVDEKKQNKKPQN